MKRFIFITLALLFFMGGTAHAQTSPSDTFIPPTSPTLTAPATITTGGQPITAATPSFTNDGVVSAGTGSVSGTLPTASVASPDAGATTATTPAASPPGAGAGVSGSPDAAFGWLLGGIMSIFAWLAGTAGILLNDTVYYTVITMGQVANPNALSAIGVSWRIFRDLGNIILIFGFIAVGISTIVGYDSYGVGKRLPTLILVAVFINFSLFATEAVIDVGNLFATEFYTQIQNGKAVSPIASISLDPTSANNPINGGISGTVMNALGLQSLYNVQNAGAGNTNAGSALPSGSGINNNEVMLIGVLASLLFLILAFVLFSITIILVVRFVTLVLLMVIAPLGFAGLVVPGLEKTARDWWALLIREAMVAPALLLVLYVALAVITDKGFLSALGASGGTGGAGYSAIANGGSAQSLAGYAGILLAFLIAMGLLTACVIVAKRMGAIGASAATKWAGAATFGVTGWAVRNSAGRLGAYAGRGIRRIAPNEIGRTLANPFDRLSKASFSVASTGIGKGLGIELGKGQKGGYAQEVADKKKAQLDYAKSLGARDQTKEEKERVAERQAASEAAGTERDVAAQTKRQKELELAELKKREDPNNFDAVLDDKIRAAKKEVEESSETLAAANTKLATANSAAAATKKEVDDATSAKGVQQQYKANLESGSNRFITTAGGIAGGAAGGAWLGAEFGLVGGPLGVAIGSSIGAGLGAWLGKRQAWRSSASAQAASSIKSGKLASGNKAELEELLEKIEKDAKDKAGKGEDE